MNRKPPNCASVRVDTLLAFHNMNTLPHGKGFVKEFLQYFAIAEYSNKLHHSDLNVPQMIFPALSCTRQRVLLNYTPCCNKQPTYLKYSTIQSSTLNILPLPGITLIRVYHGFPRLICLYFLPHPPKFLLFLMHIPLILQQFLSLPFRVPV